MIKLDIVNQVADKTGVPKQKAEQVVDSLFNAMKDALAKVPYIVSFGNFADDTSVMADLILPDHSFLESWTDSRPETGTTMAIE